jgi:hypothetical protein
LLSYGTDYVDLSRRAAAYVDHCLRGDPVAVSALLRCIIFSRRMSGGVDTVEKASDEIVVAPRFGF